LRIFLDANILFSAAKTDGPIRELLRLLLDAGNELWVDDFVLAEARRNLERKGRAALSDFDRLLPRLQHARGAVAVDGTRDINWLPEKDRPVLGAAMALGCEVLLTGDRRHFEKGFGRVFGSVLIHSPASLFQSLALPRENPSKTRHG